MTKQLGVAFVHGWAEGVWQENMLRGHLQKAGFRLEQNAEKTDIVLAHSAGCYLVPKKNNAKLIILIGLPLWPGKPLPKSLLEKLKLEFWHHRRNRDIAWLINKLVHNIWYVVTKPGNLFRFFKNYYGRKLPNPEKSKIVLVRNKDDPFCDPNLAAILRDKRYTYISLPGLHDDCWMEPKKYVEIINHYAKELA